MSSRTCAPLIPALVLALCALACSKELAGPLKVVPADVDLVGSLDAKRALRYAQNTLPKLVPAGMHDQIPTFETLARQAMQMAGVDISRLSQVHFFGKLSGEPELAIVAEGLGAKELKGEKASEYKGLPMYSAAGGLTYTELKGLGLLLSPSEGMVKKAIDTHRGDTQGLGETERGKRLRKLMKTDEDLSTFRAYLLTGQAPMAGFGPPVEFEGAGLFFDLDKGAVATLLADEKSVGQLDTAVSLGLMGLRASLAMGAGVDLPVPIDAETKKWVSQVLNKVRTDKRKDRYTISYRGDLKPLIEKALTLGIKTRQMEPDVAKPAADAVPSAPAAPEAPAAPAAPEQPATK